MHRSANTVSAIVVLLLVATLALPAAGTGLDPGPGVDSNQQPADAAGAAASTIPRGEEPGAADRFGTVVPPGHAVAIDVHVPTMTIETSSTPVGELLDRPAPEPGDVACANTFPESFRWMGPATASVGLPGVAVTLQGTSCSAQQIDITRSMEHVRVVSAGSYHGGIQAVHWAEDGTTDGRFTVWCGGTFGMADRPPEDGDAFYEGPQDVFDTEPDLVNCYVITRGDEHPSEWDRWSAVNINWHGEGGIVDARVSLQDG